MNNEQDKNVVPAAPEQGAMAQAFEQAKQVEVAGQPKAPRKLSSLRIATAAVMEGKRVPIQKVETLLGIKSARMSSGSAIAQLFEKVDRVIDTLEQSTTGQRFHAWLDIMQENTKEDMLACFVGVNKAYKDVPKDARYTRNSEQAMFYRMYLAVGRHALEKIVAGKGYHNALTAIREAAKPIALAKKEQKLRIELTAKELTPVAGLNDEEQEKRAIEGLQRINKALQEARDKAAAEVEAAKEESATPKGIAKTLARSIMGREGMTEAIALKVASLLSDAIKTRAAEIRAAEKKIADKKAAARKAA